MCGTAPLISRNVCRIGRCGCCSTRILRFDTHLARAGCWAVYTGGRVWLEPGCVHNRDVSGAPRRLLSWRRADDRVVYARGVATQWASGKVPHGPDERSRVRQRNRGPAVERARAQRAPESRPLRPGSDLDRLDQRDGARFAGWGAISGTARPRGRIAKCVSYRKMWVLQHTDPSIRHTSSPGGKVSHGPRVISTGSISGMRLDQRDGARSAGWGSISGMGLDQRGAPLVERARAQRAPESRPLRVATVSRRA